MSHDELIHRLKSNHWPPPPSFWPPAWGWVLLFLLIGLFVFFYLFFIKKSKLQKEVRKNLLDIEQQYLLIKDVSCLRSRVAALLRRILYQKNSNLRKDLSLTELLPYVQKILPKNKDTERLILLIEKDRFKKGSEIDAKELLNLSKKQIKKCRL
jgi:hypothetical protein